MRKLGNGEWEEGTLHSTQQTSDVLLLHSSNVIHRRMIANKHFVN